MYMYSTCTLDPKERVVVGEVDGLEVFEKQRPPEQTLVERQREAAIDELAVHQSLQQDQLQQDAWDIKIDHSVAYCRDQYNTVQYSTASTAVLKYATTCALRVAALLVRMRVRLRAGSAVRKK